MNFIINLIWNGILVGIRHFEPDKTRPYYEIQIYLILIQITIYIDNRDEKFN